VNYLDHLRDRVAAARDGDTIVVPSQVYAVFVRGIAARINKTIDVRVEEQLAETE
jgi:hypothetical protein